MRDLSANSLRRYVYVLRNREICDDAWYSSVEHNHHQNQSQSQSQHHPHQQHRHGGYEPHHPYPPHLPYPPGPHPPPPYDPGYREFVPPPQPPGVDDVHAPYPPHHPDGAPAPPPMPPPVADHLADAPYPGRPPPILVPRHDPPYDEGGPYDPIDYHRRDSEADVPPHLPPHNMPPPPVEAGYRADEPNVHDGPARGRARTRAEAAADVADSYHLPRLPLVPAYRHSTAHKSKSWDEMVSTFREFVRKEGHGDVERDDPSLRGRGGGERKDDAGWDGGEENAEARAYDDDDGVRLDPSSSVECDDEWLTLRSWVREVRWVVRAEGLEEAERSSASATSPTKAQPPRPPRPPNAPSRCDSERVTIERLRALEVEPHFPLKRAFYGASPNDDASGNAPGSNADSAFRRWLDDLLHYRSAKGPDPAKADVPLKYAEYPGLGNFTNRQRNEYRKLRRGKASSMTRTKVRALDSVGFVWSVREGGHATWDSRWEMLADYKRLNGHTNVPKHYPPNPSLGFWVNEQRFQYRRLTRGKTSYMSRSKVAKMNSLGFKWTLRESKRPWNEWIRELQSYRKEHGHVDVPLKYERNPQLGSFVNNQRSEYRRYQAGEKTSMTAEKARELEDLGFKWSVREGRTPWRTRLEELREYKARRGHCDVPFNCESNPQLGQWAAKQRQQYRLYVARTGGLSTAAEATSAAAFSTAPCYLTEERVAMLDALGFDWVGASRWAPKGGRDGTEEAKEGGGVAAAPRPSSAPKADEGDSGTSVAPASMVTV
ncbi:hypothetical protein ACHAWF_014035 [Thalassiosira exigua]